MPTSRSPSVCVSRSLALSLSLSLSLSLAPSESAYFKILPRFKIHSEGERVSVDDKVILMSVKGSLRVHPSPNPLPLPGSQPKFEVTASQVCQSKFVNQNSSSRTCQRPLATPPPPTPLLHTLTHACTEHTASHPTAPCPQPPAPACSSSVHPLLCCLLLPGLPIFWALPSSPAPCRRMCTLHGILCGTMLMTSSDATPCPAALSSA